MDTKMMVTVKVGRKELSFDGIDSVNNANGHVLLFIYDADNTIYSLRGQIVRCFVSESPFTGNHQHEQYKL